MSTILYIKRHVTYILGAASNSVRQQMQFQVVAGERSKHSQIIKWPDRASLNNGSLLPLPVLVTIKHLADHSFAGCMPSKFNNNCLFLYLMYCASVLITYIFFVLMKATRGRNVDK